MKLSEVVAYRNHLASLDFEPHCAPAVRFLEGVAHTVTAHDLQISNRASDLKHNFDTVQQSINDFQDTVSSLKRQLDTIIHDMEPDYYRESYRLYEQEMCFETNEYILNRKMSIDPDSQIILQTRLRSYGDWRVPGMIFRPAREPYTEDMVPLDPLYLVDHNIELLQPCVSQFTPEYQRRLRQYVVDDYQQGSILHHLPSNQFGTVFAYNYFNYKPLEVIKRYLIEIYMKLRPSGVLMFTFNDCDRAHGVALAEQHFMCYTPGHAIKSFAEDLGFEVLYQYNGPGDINWIELRKPGELTTLRGGQTLAKIVARPK